MTSQVVTGSLTAVDGRTVPLKTTITDNADNSELKSNETYTVTSQSVGRFCDGWTIASGYVQAATGICYAYILRNGVNICNINSLSSMALGNGYGSAAVSHRFRVIPGDQLIVRTEV